MDLSLNQTTNYYDLSINSVLGTEFKNTPELKQKEILDLIAYPNPEIPDNKQPLEMHFFSLMRNLAVTSYYTSKMGIETLDYKGNQPNI